ncbi:tetratricopeptide repeat protein [Novosphingobium rhizovicinum]|uniref:Tetratricopeptide repeat protein n=1 Tax=Novosphingobium rhizovicinum TaxID=3228928 RepID=A0ABV3RFF9_9SPHN
MRRLCAVFVPAVLLTLAACGDSPAGGLADARSSFERADYHAARAALVSALREEPQNAEMLALLARTQLRLRDQEGAEQTIAELDGKIAADELARLGAELRLQQGRAPEALAMLNVDDGSPAAWRLRAAALRELGSHADVDEAFARGMAAGHDVHLAADFTRYLLENGALAQAADVHQSMRSFAPEAFETLMLQGDLAVARGHSPDAIAAYRLAIKAFPHRHEPLLALASQLKGERTDEALELLKQASGLTGGSPEIFEAQIALHAARGDWDKVRAAIQGQASMLDPTSALALTYGEALLQLGQPEQARALFTRARLLRPGDPYTGYMLGRAQLATGDPAAAWATLAPLAATVLAPEEVLQAAARAGAAIGHPDTELLRARLEPRRLRKHMALVNKAQEALDRKEWLAARSLLLTLAGANDDPEVLMRLALASSQAGRDAEAIAFADRAVALRPDDAECLHTAGMARFEAGDLQGARALLKRAVDADPRNQNIRRDLDRLRLPAA